MPDDENFANHPESITALRAAKEHDGSKWTPRDALIAALRAIDNGVIAPDMLAIVHAGPRGISYFNATPNIFELVGLLECGKLYVMEKARR